MAPHYTKGMTKTSEALKVDERISFSPVAGIIVRLQRTQFTYSVWVEHTLLVDELRRAFHGDAAGEAEARGYARGLCLGLRAGWTIERLVEVAAVAR
jgi:hypothetical protein